MHNNKIVILQIKQSFLQLLYCLIFNIHSNLFIKLVNLEESNQMEFQDYYSEIQVIKWFFIINSAFIPFWKLFH